METREEFVDKTLWAHNTLNQHYGLQEFHEHKDPMRELIRTILSHRTTYVNELAAYRTMMDRFVTWEGVRDAPLNELIDTIKTANYPEVKAPYIKAVLTAIIQERGEANIDFLHHFTTEAAMQWLNRLPGVGPKTSTLLLLFEFHKPVLPVDTHVHRVTQRIGLIGPKVSAEKAHTLLLSYLPPDAKTLFNFHKHFFWHGQRICTWYGPQCSACVLQNRCNYFQTGLTAQLSSTPRRITPVP